MDFLKKNMFAVSLGALGVGALVLLYVMVISKIIFPLGEAKVGLAEQQARYEKYKKSKKRIPSKTYRESLETQQKQWDEVIAAGKKLYEEKRDKFDELHPDFTAGDATQTADFRTFFSTTLDALKADYQKSFQPAAAAPAEGAAAPAAPEAPADGSAPAAPAPDAGAAAPAPGAPAPAAAAAAPAPAPTPSSKKGDAKEPTGPRIDPYPRFNDAEDVKKAMKELWMAIEVVHTLKDLKVSGLQEIKYPARFPERSGAQGVVVAPTSWHRWISCQVIVDMPFAQLEPFVAKILQSDRVPFRLEGVEVLRPEEAVIVSDSFKKVVTDDTEATKVLGDPAALEAIVPEPNVRVELNLSALLWAGAAPEKPADAKKTEDK
jgi:hypothetical protein